MKKTNTNTNQHLSKSIYIYITIHKHAHRNNQKHNAGEKTDFEAKTHSDTCMEMYIQTGPHKPMHGHTYTYK